MPHSKEDYAILHRQIEEHGYGCLPLLGEADVPLVLDFFGSVIQETDVVAKPNSRALVTSTEALDFHTDHHKADFVAWHCVQQTDDGGESIFVDAAKIYSEMSPSDKECLTAIRLREHKIFQDDKDSWPLLEIKDNTPRFYYSFWLLKDTLRTEERQALERFQQLIQQVVPIKLKLRPSDFLIVNNRRILHGRTAIKGNQKRFLKRFWISKLKTDEKEPICKPHS